MQTSYQHTATKLDALHRRAVKSHFRRLSRRIRDLYDLALIADSGYSDEVRKDLPSIAEIVHKSFGRGDDGIPRPRKGYASSMVFKKGSEAYRSLEETYSRLDGFVWGKFPSFEEAIELAASLDDEG